MIYSIPLTCPLDTLLVILSPNYFPFILLMLNLTGFPGGNQCNCRYSSFGSTSQLTDSRVCSSVITGEGQHPTAAAMWPDPGEGRLHDIIPVDNSCHPEGPPRQRWQWAGSSTPKGVLNPYIQNLPLSVCQWYVRPPFFRAGSMFTLGTNLCLFRISCIVSDI